MTSEVNQGFWYNARLNGDGTGSRITLLREVNSISVEGSSLLPYINSGCDDPSFGGTGAAMLFKSMSNASSSVSYASGKSFRQLFIVLIGIRVCCLLGKVNF